MKQVPALVVLAGDGSVINTDGLNAILEDPEGLRFPWQTHSLVDVLSDGGLVNSLDEEVPCDSSVIHCLALG